MEDDGIQQETTEETENGMEVTADCKKENVPWEPLLTVDQPAQNLSDTAISSTSSVPSVISC